MKIEENEIQKYLDLRRANILEQINVLASTVKEEELVENRAKLKLFFEKLFTETSFLKRERMLQKTKLKNIYSYISCSPFDKSEIYGKKAILNPFHIHLYSRNLEDGFSFEDRFLDYYREEHEYEFNKEKAIVLFLDSEHKKMTVSYKTGVCRTDEIVEIFSAEK